MTTWRHTENVTLRGGPTCRTCFADARHCTKPTPDPASPCGHPTGWRGGPTFCGKTADQHDQGVVYVPTRCLSCGHAIEATR